MEKIKFSKKQIGPLVEKFQINPDTNDVFNALLGMFEDKINYQVWAIKTVFSGIATIDEIKKIKNWVDEHNTEVKNLIKGNVVSYKNKAQINQLMIEMEGLDKLKFVKDCINRFNTLQRDILRENILSNIDNGLDANQNNGINFWVSKFKAIMSFPMHRQEKMISVASPISTYGGLRDYLLNSLTEGYDWEKEDFIAYLNFNCKDCKVVYDKDNVVIIQVPSFDSSRKLCGGGRTGWCLTREEGYFKRYVLEPDNATQYFLFNFDRKEEDDLSHIGFTVQASKGITNAHSTMNHSLVGSGYEINGKYVSIDGVLSTLGIPMNIFVKLKDLTLFQWNNKSIINYITPSSTNGKFKLVYNQNNIIIIKVNNVEHGLRELVNHTMINYHNFNNNDLYVIMNVNKSKDDDCSLMVLNYAKDKYGSKTLISAKDAFNKNVTLPMVKETMGVDMDEIVPHDEIDGKLLLHKYINEEREEDAVNLVNKDENLDVNFMFENIIPIFKVVKYRMFELFKAIVNHKNFDMNIQDNFGEPLLHCLMFNYKIDGYTSFEDDDMTKKMINIIINNENIDFNAIDINDDSAINIACERPELNWVTEKLASNPNVNLNIVNDFNCTSIGNAIRRKNIEAIKILSKRMDLVLREDDYELARTANINLDDFFGKKENISLASFKPKDNLSELFSQALAYMNS